MRRVWKGWGSTLVLLYHRVAVPEYRDRWELCVPPDRFAEHLDILTQRYSRQTLRQYVAGESRTWHRRVAITFDDGYRDNFEAALPLLEKFEWPATVFVCTGPVSTGKPFWWDQFERCQDGAEAEYLTAYREWQRLAEAERQDRFARHNAIDVPATAYPMTSAQVSYMAAHPLIEVGAHTVTHPLLASISATQQRWELVQSKETLQQWTGRSVDLLAYPYGGADAFTSETARLARESGFACGASTRGRVARRGDDPFALPRWTVPNLDGDQFAKAIRRVFET